MDMSLGGRGVRCAGGKSMASSAGSFIPRLSEQQAVECSSNCMYWLLLPA